jgi:DNA polymerase III delta subunit
VPALRVEQLEESLLREGPGPLYLLVGTGCWFRNRALDLLRRAVVSEEEEESLAVTRARVGECDLSAVVDAARTLPLAVARRFIALEGGEELAADGLNLLAEYAARPQPTTTLAVCAERLPGRGKAARDLADAAVRVDCPELRAYEIPRWLDAEIRRRGFRCETGVTARLQEILGNDPAELAAGLDKLILYLGTESGTLRVEDVGEALERIPHGTVWEFLEALEEKDAGRALRALDAILELGEPADSVLRLVVRSRRQLLAGLSARARGGGDDEVLEAMGTPPKARAAPRVRRAILRRLAAHELTDVARSFPRLLEADSHLKGGGCSDARVVLTRLVVELSRRGDARQAPRP